MQLLIIINADEGAGRRPQTAMRLAAALVRNENTGLRLFIVGDERPGSTTSSGSPTRDDLDVHGPLEGLVAAGAEVRVSGSCPRLIDGDGIDALVGVAPATMRELSEWTLAADRVLVF